MVVVQLPCGTRYGHHALGGPSTRNTESYVFIYNYIYIYDIIHSFLRFLSNAYWQMHTGNQKAANAYWQSAFS